MIAIIFGGFYGGCSSSADPVAQAKAVIEEHADQRDLIGADYFGRIAVAELPHVIDKLERSGILRSNAAVHKFVPGLSSYPGWFDFGLAARASGDDVSTYLDGRVRIFRTQDHAFVLVLSERSNARHPIGAPADNE